MAEINPKLVDKILRFQIDARRLEAGERKRILGILGKAEKEMLSRMGEGEILSFNKRKLAAFIAALSEPISDAFQTMQAVTAETLAGVAELQVIAAAKTLDQVFIGYNAGLPPQSVLERLAQDVLINGGPLKDWWGKQRSDTLFKLSGAVREGVLLGQTNQQIVSKLTGTRTTPGVLTITRKNASALVHTAVHSVVNDARQSVYNQNRSVIDSYFWFSSMDSHVCLQCIGFASLEGWKNDGNHTPIGHSVPFQVPPIHFNDRCVILPRTKSFRELGLDLPKLPVGERASSLGPIAADTSFADYLKMHSNKVQDEMLGKGRADLFRDKKITLNQLLDGQGRELTLKQLQDKYK